LINFGNAPGHLPPGERIYAVGDIHGRIDRLSEVHDQIAADLIARPVGSVTLVHLGDYIDRGPASAAVIERLINPIPALRQIETVNLLGNHEAFLLEAMVGDNEALEDWMDNGGRESLMSWGLTMDNWRQGLPAQHIRFMEDLESTHIRGSYMFVHAGIRPSTPLIDQTMDDFLWIREPFLSCEEKLPHVVVHGHTPEFFMPIVRYNRIGVDTGAVYGGPLTCLVLEGNQMGFIFSDEDDDEQADSQVG